MYSGFRSDLVPHRLQPHPNNSVEILELGISDIYIIEIKILSASARGHILKDKLVF